MPGAAGSTAGASPYVDPAIAVRFIAFLKQADDQGIQLPADGKDGLGASVAFVEAVKFLAQRFYATPQAPAFCYWDDILSLPLSSTAPHSTPAAKSVSKMVNG